MDNVRNTSRVYMPLLKKTSPHMGPVSYCQIKQRQCRNLTQLIRNHILERTHQFTKVFFLENLKFLKISFGYTLHIKPKSLNLISNLPVFLFCFFLLFHSSRLQGKPLTFVNCKIYNYKLMYNRYL